MPPAEPRYLIDVGNGSPDEHETFAAALSAFRANPEAKALWRNDADDSGDHCDGLSAYELTMVAPREEYVHRE